MSVKLGILPLRILPSHRREKFLFPSSPEKGENCSTAQKDRSGPFGQVSSAGSVAAMGNNPSTVLTVFTSWALPVMASGSKCHRTLIWDFRMWLIRDVLPPASVVGWHHVVMDLLKEYREGAKMKATSSAKNSWLAWGKGADSFISSHTQQGISYLASSQITSSSESLWSAWLITLGEN